MKTNYYFYIALVILVLTVILFFTVLGFHPQKQKILVLLSAIILGVISYFFPLIGCILAVVFLVGILVWYYQGQARIKENPADWMNYRDFLETYDETAPDESGCYVMLVQKQPTKTMDLYERAYVGSSPTIHKEIHKVLTHAKLSRPYDDIQKGLELYIRIIPTSENQLNPTQQKLIEKYHAMPYLLSFQEVREKEKVH